MPARNLGENQTRTPEVVGKTDLGNYETKSAGRPIDTTVQLGSRGADGFKDSLKHIDFGDNTARTYGRMGRTYGA